MESRFLEIGFGNWVNSGRVIAIVGADSAPARRMIQDAKDRGTVIDATSGKKTRSVLVMDSDHIVMSAESADELMQQLREATNVK